MGTDKIRIYDLARELGTPNKDLMTILKKELNINVKSHSSTISKKEADIIKNIVQSSSKPEPKAVEPKPEPAKTQQEEVKQTVPVVAPVATKEPPPKATPQVPPAVQQRPHEGVKYKPVSHHTAERPPAAKQEEGSKPVQKPTFHVSGDKYKYRPENRMKHESKPERFPSRKPHYGAKPSAQPMGAQPQPAETPKTEPIQEQTSTTTPEVTEVIQKQPVQRPVNPHGQTHFRQPLHQRPDNRTPRPDSKPHERPFHRYERPDNRPPRTDRPGVTDRTDRPPRPAGFERPQGERHRFNKPAQPKTETTPMIQDAPAATNKPVNKTGHKKDYAKKKDFYHKEKFQDLKPLTEIIKKKKAEKKEVIEIQKPSEVKLDRQMTIAELAEILVVSPTEIIKELMKTGIFATLNETLSLDAAKDVAEKLEYTVITEEATDAQASADEVSTLPKPAAPEGKNLSGRAPIVTIMGHVDHGKTTLLDAIRKTKNRLVDAEVGGITQSIGAYSVEREGRKIVFIDTPGHEAFTAMRARGANATDIVILIVAADDGIMPQTIEAINHAKAASVPILVAINKCDKAGSDPDRVLQQLTEHNLIPEEWGGDIVTVKISAMKGEGIDELLEMILLIAELHEYKADHSALATGVVIESQLDKGKGAIASILVQNGTLKVGDSILVGNVGGKIRALINDIGERITSAGPSTPVEILGLGEVPQAGDLFQVVSDDKTLKQMLSKRKDEDKERRLTTITPIQLQKDTIFKAKQKGGKDEIKELNMIIKADTDGSAKAVEAALVQLKSKEIMAKIIHVGVGDISEADVMLAATSNAMIIGFKVKEDPNAAKVSATEEINIRTYDIIYQISEDIEKTMLGLLKPKLKEVELGTAEVRNLFTVGKNLVIAGCYVLEGKIVRNRTAVVLRQNKEIFKGNLDNLKRFKDDAKEVASGYECGISFNKFNDFQEGDIIKVTTFEEIERENLN